MIFVRNEFPKTRNFPFFGIYILILDFSECVKNHNELIFNVLLFWHAIGYMLIISAKVESNLKKHSKLKKTL